MGNERRHELHDLLVDVIGSTNVYFQPPSSVRLNYPCIVYNRDGYTVRYADNDTYIDRDRYTLNCITKDPDSDIPKRIRKLKHCSFDRHYAADNLYHDVFTIFY